MKKQAWQKMKWYSYPSKNKKRASQAAEYAPNGEDKVYRLSSLHRRFYSFCLACRSVIYHALVFFSKLVSLLDSCAVEVHEEGAVDHGHESRCNHEDTIEDNLAERTFFSAHLLYAFCFAPQFLCTLDATDMFHALTGSIETARAVAAQGAEIALYTAVLRALGKADVAKAPTKFRRRHFVSWISCLLLCCLSPTMLFFSHILNYNQ